MKNSEAQGAIKAAEYWPIQGLQSGHSLRTASVEELNELKQYYANELVRAEHGAEEATRFRPNYAPAGRLTKSESQAQIAVRVAREVLDGVEAARLLVINNKSREF